MNSKVMEHLCKRQKILDGRQGRKYKRKTDRQAKRQNRKKTVRELTSLTYRAEEWTDQSDSRKAKKRQSKSTSKKKVRGGSRDREQSSSSIPLHDTKAACITVLPVTLLQLQPNFHRVWVRNMHICVYMSECVWAHSIFCTFTSLEVEVELSFKPSLLGIESNFSHLSGLILLQMITMIMSLI